MKRNLRSLGLILALMVIWSACAFKIGGNAVTQDKLVVTDTLRVQGPSVFNGAVTFNAGTNLGGGAVTGTSVIDFDLTGANPFQRSSSFAVTGATVGKPVVVGAPLACQNDSVVYAGDVTATNTVIITARRVCGASVNPPSGTFSVTIQ